MKTKLTPMQKKFVEAYSGNATDAAREAGYKSPSVQGYENMQKPYIQEAISKREQHETRDRILTRQERQELWTRIALGKEPELKMVDGKLKEMPVAMRHRLKALECLAKSEGDFMTKIEVESDLQAELSSMTIEEMKERVRKLEEDGVLELIMNPDGRYTSRLK